MKVCTRCGHEKELTEFVRNSRLASGRGSRCLSCVREVGKLIQNDPKRRLQKLQRAKVARGTPEGKAKRKAYRSKTYQGDRRDRERVDNRNRLRVRRAVVSELKATPCQDCGGQFPPCCMDFDHVRDTKFRDIGLMVSRNNIEAIRTEIAKCDLVCACCHRVRTWGVRNVVNRADVQRTLDRIADLKKRPCADCCRSLPPTAMDFDHVRGTKVASVSYLAAKKFSWQTIEDEIAKCDPVCANCHRIRTQSRKAIQKKAA